MSDERGTTVGVWIPEDSDIIEEFDREVVGPGGSRSAHILQAMELLIAVEDVLGTVGVDLDPRERRMLVRQALLDHFREE
jgi:hypothetical protein